MNPVLLAARSFESFFNRKPSHRDCCVWLIYCRVTLCGCFSRSLPLLTTASRRTTPIWKKSSRPTPCCTSAPTDRSSSCPASRQGREERIEKLVSTQFLLILDQQLLPQWPARSLISASFVSRCPLTRSTGGHVWRVLPRPPDQLHPQHLLLRGQQPFGGHHCQATLVRGHHLLPNAPSGKRRSLQGRGSATRSIVFLIQRVILTCLLQQRRKHCRFTVSIPFSVLIFFHVTLLRFISEYLE